MLALGGGGARGLAHLGVLEAFEPEVTQQPVRVEKVPGRNDPCWCGSGKKFKACHGR